MYVMLTKVLELYVFWHIFLMTVYGWIFKMSVCILFLCCQSFFSGFKILLPNVVYAVICIK